MDPLMLNQRRQLVRYSTPTTLPAPAAAALCDWAARTFFVVWINFACRRLTGHAQNNSVTTNVTGPREFICMTRYLGWNILCTLPVKIYPCFKTNMSCVWELSERTFLRSKPLSRPRIVQTDSAFHCQKSFRSYIQVAYASTNDYHTV